MRGEKYFFSLKTNISQLGGREVWTKWGGWGSGLRCWDKCQGGSGGRSGARMEDG